MPGHTGISIDDDMHDGPVDYSSFDYQHVTYQHESGGGNSGRTTIKTSVEPLQGAGGLDVNEVAELVGYNFEARFAGDGYGALFSGDQLAGSAEYRGAFGVNLPASTQPLIENQGATGQSTIFDEDDGGSVTTATAFTDDDPAILEMFDIDLFGPYADTASGTGGGGGLTRVDRFKNWRAVTGRGPVLDAEDELAVVSRQVKNQMGVNIDGRVTVNLIWDVAEIDDAGARFSVPENR